MISILLKCLNELMSENKIRGIYIRILSTTTNIQAKVSGRLDGWMDPLRFCVLFNSISVISGRCSDDNERLCAMEPRLRFEKISPRTGILPGPLHQ